MCRTVSSVFCTNLRSKFPVVSDFPIRRRRPNFLLAHYPRFAIRTGIGPAGWFMIVCRGIDRNFLGASSSSHWQACVFLKGAFIEYGLWVLTLFCPLFIFEPQFMLTVLVSVLASWFYVVRKHLLSGKVVGSRITVQPEVLRMSSSLEQLVPTLHKGCSIFQGPSSVQLEHKVILSLIDNGDSRLSGIRTRFSGF